MSEGVKLMMWSSTIQQSFGNTFAKGVSSLRL